MARFTIGLEGDGKAITRRAHRYPAKAHIDGPGGVRARLTAEYDPDTDTTTYTMWRAEGKASGCTCTDHQHHPSRPVHSFKVKGGA